MPVSPFEPGALLVRRMPIGISSPRYRKKMSSEGQVGGYPPAAFGGTVPRTRDARPGGAPDLDDRSWRKLPFSRSPPFRASRPFAGPIREVAIGSRNYGDRDKGLAPLSL